MELPVLVLRGGHQGLVPDSRLRQSPLHDVAKCVLVMSVVDPELLFVEVGV